MNGELSFSQCKDLLVQARDVFTESVDSVYPDDQLFEIVDCWLPVYYTHIRAEWVAANCPEPDADSLGEFQDIHNAMLVGLSDCAYQFLSGLLFDAETWGDAVAMIDDYMTVKEVV